MNQQVNRYSHQVVRTVRGMQVLGTAMNLVGEDGCVLVLEYQFLPDFPSMARLEGEQRMYTAEMFSASVLHCLPVSKVLSSSL
jgi:hypothetical protein